MVRIVKFALVLGAAVASGSSLRKLVPDAADTAVAKTAKRDTAKTGKGSSSKAPPALVLTRGDMLKKATAKLNFSATDFSAFWQGRDFPEERIPMKVLAPDDGKEAKRNVHVFGLQDSGTSLLKAYLYTNFGHRLNYFDGAFPTNKKPNKRKGLWAYSNFKELNRLEHDKIESLNEAEVHAISVLRNPYGWLQTVRTGKTPLLMECVQGDDWLTKPCSHPSPGGPASKVGSMDFQSIAGIWNHWSEGFKKADEYGFSRNLVVKYEDLVLHPEAVLTRIANYLDLKKPVSGWNIPFEEVAERGEAFQLVSSGAFLNEGLTPMENQQACVHLDPDVLEVVEYEVFDCSQFTNGPPPQFTNLPSHTRMREESSNTMMPEIH